MGAPCPSASLRSAIFGTFLRALDKLSPAHSTLNPTVSESSPDCAKPGLIEPSIPQSTRLVPYLRGAVLLAASYCRHVILQPQLRDESICKDFEQQLAWGFPGGGVLAWFHWVTDPVTSVKVLRHLMVRVCKSVPVCRVCRVLWVQSLVP